MSETGFPPAYDPERVLAIIQETIDLLPLGYQEQARLENMAKTIREGREVERADFVFLTSIRRKRARGQ